MMTDWLSGDPQACETAYAEAELKKLDEKCEEIGFMTQRMLEEGENLASQLLLPVKTANGQDIPTNNQQHKQEAENNIARSLERKQRCDELANIRRVKLKEIIELNKCENETEKVSFILALWVSICEYLCCYY